MPFVRLPGVGVAHVRVSGVRKSKACAECFSFTRIMFQCDWKVAKGTRRCDRILCEAHATAIATEKHVCPEHKVSFRAWELQRAQQPLFREEAQ